MPRVNPLYVTVLNDTATTGAGVVVNVTPYRHVAVSIATDGGADASMTVKAQGSIQVSEPAFGSAQSKTNHWDYVEMIDAEDGASVAGDTGWSVAGADDYRLFYINTDNLRWLTLNLTARAQGEVTVKVMGADNG